MKFYEIDNALKEAISNQRFATATKPVRLKIELGLPWGVESVFEQDVMEADFFGLKEAAGGTSARGEILLDNSQGAYSYSSAGPGTVVKVSFSLGEGLPWFERFIFYINDKGVQDVRGPGRRRFVRLGLRDLSARLRKSDENRDWTAPAVFTYSVVCDKSQPGRSLVHGIARRVGLGVNDIDCATIPVTLPYVRLTKNIWAELSDVAKTYRCHLECAPEKPLVFAHSPYQAEPLADEECSYTFSGEDIFYLRKTARAELYRNTVRLKINLPVSLEKQEIWRYDDPPVLYDEFLQCHYPFKYPLVREIENGKYEARYSIVDTSGKERSVVYADEIDSKEEAEKRIAINNEQLSMNNGMICYSHYDVTSHSDRAILGLHKEKDVDLYNASIYGRPIVLDLNRSCFLHDSEGIATHGTAALNVTGSYFSEYEMKNPGASSWVSSLDRKFIVLAGAIPSVRRLQHTVLYVTFSRCKQRGMDPGLPINGKPQYEDWVVRELAERIRNSCEYTVKTHRGLFNARVGAKVKLEMRNEELEGIINAFTFRYRKNEAFQSSFHITQEMRS